MSGKWSRTPKHILRVGCIKHITRSWQPGRFIEFGAGTGDITEVFVKRGFTGVCYDIGQESRDMLRERFGPYGGRLEVADQYKGLAGGSFGYLFAFEVLEHIEDDCEALKDWTRLLQKGGKALISVPAHRRKFSDDDRSVGHVRRYEKSELARLLQRCGYEGITVLNYGFPFGNLTRIAYSLIRGKNRTPDCISPAERSIRSGVESSGTVNALSFFFREELLYPFLLIQRLFLTMDWGDGYVAFATKR